MKCYTIMMIVFLTVTATLQASLPEDLKSISALVGTWIVPQNQTTAVLKSGGLTFSTNGTFASYGIFVIKGQQTRIDVMGKWTVDKGVLIQEITKSSHPAIPPIGSVTRDTLFEVTDQEYRYRTESGRESYRIRKTEANQAAHDTARKLADPGR